MFFAVQMGMRGTLKRVLDVTVSLAFSLTPPINPILVC